MSTEHNDGGYAFPVSDSRQTQYGMSLRDYFAAKAMQGILAANCAQDQMAPELAQSILAHGAYGIADAMIAERDK